MTEQMHSAMGRQGGRAQIRTQADQGVRTLDKHLLQGLVGCREVVLDMCSMHTE